MEEDVLRLLGAIQNPSEAPRRQAEQQLVTLYSHDGFPIALLTIAGTKALDLTARQAAAVYLRTFIDTCWSSPYESYQGPPIKDEVKTQVRTLLLQLLGDSESKIRGAIAFSISKIAGQDFPEEWPSLLQDLMSTIPNATDAQLHGTLKVLSDLVEDGFNEEQFFAVASQLVEVLYNITASEMRPKSLRALAVSIFRTCVELLEMVKEDHPAQVQDFATKIIDVWVPLMTNILQQEIKTGVPSKTYQGLACLKLQILKTITTTLKVFPNIMTRFMVSLFTVAWEEINRLKDQYVEEFIEGDVEARQIDSDGLPYSLDLLMLEELDFLQSCLRSKSVKEEYMRALQSTSEPLDRMIFACVCLSQVTSEERETWEVDNNAFLAEETAVSSNYTCRTSSGDMIMKLVEWLNQSMPAILKQCHQLFANNANWKMLEAVLFLLNQAMDDSLSTWSDGMDEATAMSILSYVDYAIKSEHDLLRARGYLVTQALNGLKTEILSDPMTTLGRRLIETSLHDTSDIVKISCIKALGSFLVSERHDTFIDQQKPLIQTIGTFFSSQPSEDWEEMQEILSTLADTLGAVIKLNTRAVLDASTHVVDIIFSIASKGASNLFVAAQIQEIIDEITTELSEDFEHVCEALLPPIINVLDQETFTSDEPLSNLSAELLTTMLRNATPPLPSGFIQLVLPRLSKCLMLSNETNLLQSCTESLKFIIELDVKQVLSCTEGKSGLEVVLFIIDRLLRPDLSDQSALEVGGLAAELVDKAADELGQYLPELLKAVAGRLAIATAANLIQSLILVFARLVIARPKEVVDFLASTTIASRNGLEVVMTGWLENSNVFSGYSEIRQNVVALTQLFTLGDSRLASINVQGEQIISQSNRIMTRAQTKNNPIRYTIVPVPVKIIKLLIVELGSGSAPSALGTPWKVDETGDEEEDENNEWEDDDTLDLSNYATKKSLLALGLDEDDHAGSRRSDDETQSYLMDFFREVSSKNLGHFQEVYAALLPEEQEILSSLMTASVS